MKNLIRKILKEEFDNIDKIVNLLLSPDESNNELAFYLIKYNIIPIENIIKEIIDNFKIKNDEIDDLREKIFNLENDDALEIIDFNNDLISIYLRVFNDYYEEDDSNIYAFNWDIRVLNEHFSDFLWTIDDISNACLEFNYYLDEKVKPSLNNYFKERLENI